MNFSNDIDFCKLPLMVGFCCVIWFVANWNRFSAVLTKVFEQSTICFVFININFKIAFASTVIEPETLLALAVSSVILLFNLCLFY